VDKENSYDAIIIGSGIGGLVCGCYLAKAGFKVLIVEKNSNVGGCCTSFVSKGFTFDAFAHSLGGLRNDGILKLVLHELNLSNAISINRQDPSDIFVAPDFKITFWNNLRKTINDLKVKFPKEASNIDSLMQYFSSSRGADSIRLRDITFSVLLAEFIKNKGLKAILSMPVFGNTGLSPSRISAFTAVKLYQEFILDGGYYPEGGMQVFSDKIAECFRVLGGTLITSNRVSKIFLDNRREVSGVELRKGGRIFSKIVISNTDVTQTFQNFLRDAGVRKPAINNMKKSSSVFSIYFGADKNIADLCGLNATVWHMFNYDIERMCQNAEQGNFERIDWFMIFLSPDKRGFVISILAPFMNKEFWENNKDFFAEKILLCAKNRIPALEKSHIKFRTIVTPQIIEKWTSNSEGAAYGWASIPSQCVVLGLTQNTSVKGLYLTGHWTTQTLGVSGVAYMGRDTAQIIIRRHKK
jgi:phytoene dehydrogenase-like protein